jgi:Fe(3+) dicitrate transport protein
MSWNVPSRLAACATLLLPGLALADGSGDGAAASSIEEMTVLGDPRSIDNLAGAARVLGPEEIERFAHTDIHELMREVPGVYFQTEDGLGLRPNIGIRGTGTERSGRITLLEDGVLIAPAPYAASSAYYFPAMARMHSVEVLKGPAAVRQGPYTVGGAVNLISTPIPDSRSVQVRAEAGSHGTRLGHLSYGDRTEHAGWLLETLQSESDGFKDIDRSGGDTGYEIEDYLAKFRLNTSADADWYQELTLKLQYSEETSDQSYLGLTDADFAADAERMYGLSALDEMNTEHQQRTLSWKLRTPNDTEILVTAYDHDFERAWFKTEGIDLDGAASADAQSRTSWLNVVDAVNRNRSLTAEDGTPFGPAALQAILDGTADTAANSIQVRNNAREYYSRGVQGRARFELDTGDWNHAFEIGARWHEDEEDRLQRNSGYSQQGGELVLDDRGTLGNAGNRIQEAEARAFWIVDTITRGDWTFTPGLRHEDIDLARTRYLDVPTRTAADFRDQRENEVSVWLPGMGVHYRVNPQLGVFAGAHKGFSTPTNDPDTDEEESINYELGLRFADGPLFAELIGFYNDYDNLLGVCTNSSGGDCNPGEVFEGDAITVLGLEARLEHRLELADGWSMPVALAWTWTDSEFDTDIADPGFFGDAEAGDPLPYLPDHQGSVSVGLARDNLNLWLRGNYQDETCVQPSCGRFLETDSSLTFDLSGSWQWRPGVEFYAVAQNLTDEEDILGRQPYGARPGKPQALKAGVRWAF